VATEPDMYCEYTQEHARSRCVPAGSTVHYRFLGQVLRKVGYQTDA
jgi:hypothetical protein